MGIWEYMETNFLRVPLPKAQSSSLLQASSELGERRYNSGYLNYKSGHSFYKTTVQAAETPELCPVFNSKGQRGKITLWKTNALRTPHRSSQRAQEFLALFCLAIFSAPVCVTAPKINGEGTETLCITFLYKKRKITALNIKRLKRAFPFVLRGLVIFEYVGVVYF